MNDFVRDNNFSFLDSSTKFFEGTMSSSSSASSLSPEEHTFSLAVRAFGCGNWKRMASLGLLPNLDSKAWLTRTAQKLSRQQALETLRGLHVDFEKLAAYNHERSYGISLPLQGGLGIRTGAGGRVINTFTRTKEQLAFEAHVIATKCCFTEEEVKAVFIEDELLDTLFQCKEEARNCYNESVLADPMNWVHGPPLRSCMTSEELSTRTELAEEERQLRDVLIGEIVAKRRRL